MRVCTYTQAQTKAKVDVSPERGGCQRFAMSSVAILHEPMPATFHAGRPRLFLIFPTAGLSGCNFSDTIKVEREWWLVCERYSLVPSPHATTEICTLAESEYAIPELPSNGFSRRYKEKWEGLPQRGTQIEYGKVGGKTYENCRRGRNREYEWAHARLFPTLSTTRGRSDRWRRRWNDVGFPVTEDTDRVAISMKNLRRIRWKPRLALYFTENDESWSQIAVSSHLYKRRNNISFNGILICGES